MEPILTRGFWKSYWIALRRTGKDTRARSVGLRITFLLTYFAAYALLMAVVEANAELGQRIWDAVGATLIVATGTVAAVLIRRRNQEQDALLHASLTGRVSAHTVDASDAPVQVRNYLEERALIIASLLARGASEIHIRQRQIPSGMEVVTRQVQNSLMRQYGLWEKLEQAEADLARAPDGAWSIEQANRVLMWCEQLRVLRWVMRIDSELMPLAHFPTLDFSLSRDVLRKGRPLDREPLLKSWDARGERDVAAAYTARVVAELKARQLVAGGPEFGRWADDLRARSVGDSTDLLAGARTIRDLTDEELRMLGTFASAREGYCAYLVELLSADKPFAFSTWAARRF